MPTLRTNVGSTSDNVAAFLRRITGEDATEEETPQPEAPQAPELEPQADDVAPDDEEFESEAEEPDESELEPQGADSGATEALERPHPHFGKKEEWYAFRLAQGYSEEELAGLGRNDLRDKLEDR